jgi:phosphatidylglycerol:prolipoprotein diacylglycerol transferase
LYSRENALLPYIHLGPLEIPTFGLLMVMAFAASYFALEAEIVRRKLGFTPADLAWLAEDKSRKLMKLDPYTIVAVVAFAGIIGAKIWHIVDTPADRLTLDTLKSFGAFFVWLRGGFAWFGGFVAGIAALLVIARQNRINMLTMLDLCSPAAAIGYAVGRIGCLISGDGDYGKPTNLPWGMSFPDGLVPTTQTCGQAIDALHPHGWPATCAVHPTPIYEFIACVLIGWYVWHLGSRIKPLPPGIIVGEFLVLFGVERFLVEFIRINPRIFLGMSNAQVAALLTVFAGMVLLAVAWSSARKTRLANKASTT